MTRRALGASLAALTLGLGACGGGDDDGDGGGSASDDGGSSGASTTEVRVTPRSGEEGFSPEEIYERDGPGVVTVISAGLRQPAGEEGGGGGGAGQGSGFVVSDSGEIVTNAHVVSSGLGEELRPARDVYIKFSSGDRVEARIVGLDPFSDVALLRVEPEGLELRPLKLAEVDELVVGAPVAAIGSPFGEERSLSVGVISALDRDIESLTGFRTSGAIQTDAAINSGNSGGPLLDADGDVLGINSQIRTRSGDGSGVGFAVPADIVERSIGQLREDGKVAYPFVGVSTQDIFPQLAERFDLGVERGAWVQEVSEGGPADRAGLRAQGPVRNFQEIPYLSNGDVITKVDGDEVEGSVDVGRLLEDKRPGQTVTMEILREGDRREVKVRLGERPLELPRG